MRHSLLAAFAVLLLLPPVHAQAADIIGARPLKVAVPVIEDDYSSGWYVRGDLGASLHPSARIGMNGTGFSDARFDNAFFAGAGLGFKYQAFRIDLTGDWRTSARTSAVLGNDRHGFAVGSQSLLLNAYYDLGPFAGFSPYIGAGIGAARLSLHRHTLLPAAGGAETAGAALTSATRINFAWSLMAGLAYDVTPQLKLDLGYRYLNNGSVNFADSAGNAYRLAAPAAHEFRIGLRYMFSDGLPTHLHN